MAQKRINCSPASIYSSSPGRHPTRYPINKLELKSHHNLAVLGTGLLAMLYSRWNCYKKLIIYDYYPNEIFNLINQCNFVGQCASQTEIWCHGFLILL